jgi:hypothetical protein
VDTNDINPFEYDEKTGTFAKYVPVDQSVVDEWNATYTLQ